MRSHLATFINLESHLAIPFIQSWNTRSLLATSFDQYWNTRSLPAISNNLESHLAIPFIQYEIWGPFWRPPLTNIEIWDPFWRSQITWNPIGQFLLPKLKHEVPSGDLHRNTRSLLAISFIQTTWNPIWRFLLYKSWNLRSLLATSIEIRDPFWRSQQLGIPFGDSFLPNAIDVVLPAGMVWKPLSSLLVVLESTQWFFLRLQFCWNVLRSPPVTIQKNIYAMIYD